MKKLSRWIVTVKWRVSYSAPMGRSTVAVDAYSMTSAKSLARIRVGAPVDAPATAKKA